MKIILLASALFFFWFFFHRRGSLLGFFTFHIANHVLANVLAVIRAFLFGYIVYALVAVYASFGRISTFGDVITILSARPSQVGGPGIIGVILGILIGVVTLSSPISYVDSQPTVLQARRVVYRTRLRRISEFFFGRIRSIARSLKNRRNGSDSNSRN